MIFNSLARGVVGELGLDTVLVSVSSFFPFFVCSVVFASSVSSCRFSSFWFVVFLLCLALVIGLLSVWSFLEREVG